MPNLNPTRDSQTILDSLQLPAEIWANVILYVDDENDLVALCRTWRVTQLEAERALYRHLRVDGRSLLFEHLNILPLRLAEHVRSIIINEPFLFDLTTEENDHIRETLM